MANVAAVMRSCTKSLFPSRSRKEKALSAPTLILDAGDTQPPVRLSRMPTADTQPPVGAPPEAKGAEPLTPVIQSSGSDVCDSGRSTSTAPISPERSYHSDVRNDRWPTACRLTHQNHGRVWDVYEPVDAPILGSGAGGVVRTVVRHDTHEEYAMKTVALAGMDARMIACLRKEVEIQRRLTHPNICRVFESFEEEGKMYIIMEHCTGGSLVDRLKARPSRSPGYGERRTATLVEKMLSAVVYCHHNGVVHRDIKLDNFIFESEDPDAEVKLIDFGFAAEVAPGRETMREQLGTPSYMAPELWMRTSYDSAVDVWALGVVAFMLLSGRRPFHHRDAKEKEELIKHGPLVFGRTWEGLSDESRAFCRALLHKNPRKRLSAEEALEHAFIRRKSRLHKGEDAAHELANHTEIFDAVEDYCESSDAFHKLSLEAIAFATPPAKLEELRTVFVKMDLDDSGTISLKEFKEAMSMHPEISSSKLEQMFARIDLNHSGDIDYLEFLSATVSTQPAGHGSSAAMAAFSILDNDGDGLIGRDDIRTAVKGSFSDADVDKMLSTHGRDGLIDFKHFSSFISHIVCPSPRSSPRSTEADRATEGSSRASGDLRDGPSLD